MSFFSSLLKKRNLNHHDLMPLWKSNLNNEEVNDLINILQSATLDNLDPRDLALYYAIWWQKSYNGGIPSKQKVFESLEGHISYFFDEEDFYLTARTGASSLGVSWIKKQNTLYFKTLLLQGGLPLKHISENQGKYKAFLVAVLEEQPETIEDFIFKTHITNLLPKSSQNDIIYENCFEIVKSILNDDGLYDELLDSEESIKEITSFLKIKKASLKKKVRKSKPKNYWLLSKIDDEYKIRLRLGLADRYTNQSLTNILGFEATSRAYEFYLDDNLICIFRKMTNGHYKTDWYNQGIIEWNISEGLPYTYVIVDGRKSEITDFIQTIPNTEKPSLWSKYNDEDWRLIKGTTTLSQEAAILFPSNWCSNIPSSKLPLYEENLNWLCFEGEAQMKSNDGEIISYLSGVNSFDWIIQSNKPKWILKSNLPIVQSVPKVLIYDDDGTYINKNLYKISVRKHNTQDDWKYISDLKFISTGCFDLRIEKGDLTAYDVFFNIGKLHAKFSDQSIHSAKIEFINPDDFNFKLHESTLIQISSESNCFHLNVNSEFLKIPTRVKLDIGYSGEKNLSVDLVSPFQGMAITDENGNIINPEQSLSLANLYGMRIISTPNVETLLKIKNTLQPDVIINKEIKESTQQVISFKDEILRLFYLADAMDHRNSVTLELSEGRINKEKFKISGFSHTLDVTNQLDRSVSLLDTDDKLELFAVTLSTKIEDIFVVPLMGIDKAYQIPEKITSDQVIVISSKNDKCKLMPRFVSASHFDSGIDKMERIDNYHLELSQSSFKDNIWLQVLKYFNICLQYDIPFSTFDQLRAISRSSNVASRAFFFIGVNQYDPDDYIQKAIPEMERDLGFCFHWITKSNWENSINEINDYTDNKYFEQIINLISSYMEEIGLQQLFNYITGNDFDSENISQTIIRNLRAQLGERVLNELPRKSPRISSYYGVNFDHHSHVRLLFQSPVAVAESIMGIQTNFPIWGGEEQRKEIRRNIQYSQYLCGLYPQTDFYNKTILHVLKNS